jgi:hypothetical protein
MLQGGSSGDSILSSDNLLSACSNCNSNSSRGVSKNAESKEIKIKCTYIKIKSACKLPFLRKKDKLNVESATII